jgi:dolichol-phosphate mannosyltransferase
MSIKFSLVIPTYNEKANLLELYGKLVSVLDSLSFDYEIIIVDDDSPDMTWRIAEDLAKQDKRVKVIRRTQQRGLASAVISGWASSQGEILGVIDADLQHPPEILSDMLRRIFYDNEVDIVIASRYVAGGRVLNQNCWQVIKSRLAILLGRLLIPRIFELVKDPLSGYFILRREIIEVKQLSPIGYKMLLEVLAKCSYKNILEIPFIFTQRKRGRSKASWVQYSLSLLHFVKLRLLGNAWQC